MKFINDQYEAYLQEEININRKKRIPDSRVHCCIYFIPSRRTLVAHGAGKCLCLCAPSAAFHVDPALQMPGQQLLRVCLKSLMGERQEGRERHRESVFCGPDVEFKGDVSVKWSTSSHKADTLYPGGGWDFQKRREELRANGIDVYLRRSLTRCGGQNINEDRGPMQNIKDITSSIHYEMYRAAPQ
ncbi:septin 9b isoform X2 [Lates japonicus]|uniref:Septin 9b isoform X2 n=1 Tax=Lates japonicus TaxID=270547 RepID=A0AAD3N6B0_LATJO|nr:septin 9b isoform X2 [Lates japonicus]